jgi:hypothetical protein
MPRQQSSKSLWRIPDVATVVLPAPTKIRPLAKIFGPTHYVSFHLGCYTKTSIAKNSKKVEDISGLTILFVQKIKAFMRRTRLKKVRPLFGHF